MPARESHDRRVLIAPGALPNARKVRRSKDVDASTGGRSHKASILSQRQACDDPRCRPRDLQRTSLLLKERRQRRNRVAVVDFRQPRLQIARLRNV